MKSSVLADFYRGVNPDLQTAVDSGPCSAQEITGAQLELNFQYDDGTSYSPKTNTSPPCESERRTSPSSVASLVNVNNADVQLTTNVSTSDKQLGETPNIYPYDEIPESTNDAKSRSCNITRIDSEQNADVYGLLLALQAAHRSVSECQNELRLSLDEFQAYRHYAEGKIAELERSVQELRFQRTIQSSLNRQEKLQSMSTLTESFNHIRLDLNTLKESVLVCGDFFTLSLKKLGYRLNEALLRKAKVSLRKRTVHSPKSKQNANSELSPNLDRLRLRNGRIHSDKTSNCQ